MPPNAGIEIPVGIRVDNQQVDALRKSVGRALQDISFSIDKQSLNRLADIGKQIKPFAMSFDKREVDAFYGKAQEYFSKRPIKVRVEYVTGKTSGSVAGNLKQEQKEVNRLIVAKNRLAEATAKADVATEKQSRSTAAAADITKSFADRLGLTAVRLSAYLVPASAIFQLTRGIGIAKDEIVSLDRELNKLTQVLDGNVARSRGIADEALGIAEKYGQAGDSVLKITTLLAQSGNQFSSNSQILSTVEALSKSQLAATFGDIDQTTEGVIATLNQFNLSGEKTLDILDSANQLSKKFAVESGDLFEAVRSGGAAFSEFGGNVQEFQAVVTSLRQLTRLSASTIGTGLNTIVQRVRRPETLKFIENMGVQVEAPNGKLLGFIDLLTGVAEKFKTLDKRQQAIVTNELFDVRQGKLGIKLLQDLSKESSVTKQAVAEAFAGAGSLSRDAEIGLKRLDVMFQSVGTRFEQAFINIAKNNDLKNFLADVAVGLKSIASLLDTIAPVLPSLLRIGTPLLFVGGIKSIPKVVRGAKSAINNVTKDTNDFFTSPYGEVFTKTASSVDKNTIALNQNTAARIKATSSVTKDIASVKTAKSVTGNRLLTSYDAAELRENKRNIDSLAKQKAALQNLLAYRQKNFSPSDIEKNRLALQDVARERTDIINKGGRLTRATKNYSKAIFNSKNYKNINTDVLQDILDDEQKSLSKDVRGIDAGLLNSMLDEQQRSAVKDILAKPRKLTTKTLSKITGEVVKQGNKSAFLKQLTPYQLKQAALLQVASSSQTERASLIGVASKDQLRSTADLQAQLAYGDKKQLLIQRDIEARKRQAALQTQRDSLIKADNGIKSVNKKIATVSKNLEEQIYTRGRIYNSTENQAPGGIQQHSVLDGPVYTSRLRNARLKKTQERISFLRERQDRLQNVLLDKQRNLRPGDVLENKYRLAATAKERARIRDQKRIIETMVRRDTSSILAVKRSQGIKADIIESVLNKEQIAEAERRDRLSAAGGWQLLDQDGKWLGRGRDNAIRSVATRSQLKRAADLQAQSYYADRMQSLSQRSHDTRSRYSALKAQRDALLKTHAGIDSATKGLKIISKALDEQTRVQKRIYNGIKNQVDPDRYSRAISSFTRRASRQIVTKEGNSYAVDAKPSIGSRFVGFKRGASNIISRNVRPSFLDKTKSLGRGLRTASLVAAPIAADFLLSQINDNDPVFDNYDNLREGFEDIIKKNVRLSKVKTTGQGILSGALSGALLGSSLGIHGALIGGLAGATTGGLIGYFGNNKRQELFDETYQANAQTRDFKRYSANLARISAADRDTDFRFLGNPLRGTGTLFGGFGRLILDEEDRERGGLLGEGRFNRVTSAAEALEKLKPYDIQRISAHGYELALDAASKGGTEEDIRNRFEALVKKESDRFIKSGGDQFGARAYETALRGNGKNIKDVIELQKEYNEELKNSRTYMSSLIDSLSQINRSLTSQILEGRYTLETQNKGLASGNVLGTIDTSVLSSSAVEVIQNRVLNMIKNYEGKDVLASSLRSASGGLLDESVGNRLADVSFFSKDIRKILGEIIVAGVNTTPGDEGDGEKSRAGLSGRIAGDLEKIRGPNPELAKAIDNLVNSKDLSQYANLSVDDLFNKMLKDYPLVDQALENIKLNAEALEQAFARLIPVIDKQRELYSQSTSLFQTYASTQNARLDRANAFIQNPRQSIDLINDVIGHVGPTDIVGATKDVIAKAEDVRKLRAHLDTAETFDQRQSIGKTLERAQIALADAQEKQKLEAVKVAETSRLLNEKFKLLVASIQDQIKQNAELGRLPFGDARFAERTVDRFNTSYLGKALETYQVRDPADILNIPKEILRFLSENLQRRDGINSLNRQALGVAGNRIINKNGTTGNTAASVLDQIVGLSRFGSFDQNYDNLLGTKKELDDTNKRLVDIENQSLDVQKSILAVNLSIAEKIIGRDQLSPTIKTIEQSLKDYVPSDLSGGKPNQANNPVPSSTPSSAKPDQTETKKLPDYDPKPTKSRADFEKEEGLAANEQLVITLQAIQQLLKDPENKKKIEKTIANEKDKGVEPLEVTGKIVVEGLSTLNVEDPRTFAVIEALLTQMITSLGSNSYTVTSQQLVDTLVKGREAARAALNKKK